MIIERLELACADLDAQLGFYHALMGLDIVSSGENALELSVGSSNLVFRKNAGFSGAYHFAFNIPENQLGAAMVWLDEHSIPLLKDKNGKSAFHFASWNADAVYFMDPAGNIVELIARHDLENGSSALFNAGSLLSISEIGLAVTDVLDTVRLVRTEAAVKPYKGSVEDTFTAVGDENGLLIIVRAGREWYPDTGIRSELLPLDIHVQVNGHKYLIQGKPFRISTIN